MEDSQWQSWPTELQPGDQLAGRYAILEVLGEGGMGIVYRAKHQLTEQQVALKVIHPTLVSPKLTRHFLEEIRLLGKMQHENIVRVFDADLDRNPHTGREVLFYTMELVEGLPLMRWVEECQPGIEARLTCFSRICEAVDFAHRRGVVHRDLKPENVLVDSDGNPAVLDFGLASLAEKALAAQDASLRQESERFLRASGTPPYMSPERWDGHSGGSPADIFALGVILHELLTGIRPWVTEPNATLRDLKEAINRFDPDTMTALKARSRLAFQLARQMVGAKPESRTLSAAAVAQQIQHFLSRQAQRRRLVRSMPVWSLVVAFLAVTVYLVTDWVARNEALRGQSARNLRAAANYCYQDKADKLHRVLELLPPPRSRHSQGEWRVILLKAMSEWSLSLSDSLPLPKAFVPLVATSRGDQLFGRLDDNRWGTIRRTEVGWEEADLNLEGPPRRARFDPSGSRIALEAAGLGVRVWDSTLRNQNVLVSADGEDRAIEWSPRGRYLACASVLPGTQHSTSRPISLIHVYDSQSRQRVAALALTNELVESGLGLRASSPEVSGMAFSPDEDYLAAWSEHSLSLLIWEIRSGKCVEFDHLSDSVAAAAWRPNQNEHTLALVRHDGEVLSWEVDTSHERVFRILASSSSTLGAVGERFGGAIRWAPDGEALFVIDEERAELMVFPGSPGTGERQLQLSLLSTNGGRVYWRNSGVVSVVGQESSWSTLDVRPPIRRHRSHPGMTPDWLAFSPDTRLLVVADHRQVVFYSTEPFREVGRGELALAGPIAFDASNGDLWAYSKADGPVRWKAKESDGVMEYELVSRGFALSSAGGSLAASAGHVAANRGRLVFVEGSDDFSSLRMEEPDFTLSAVPEQLVLAATGLQVAAIWRESPTAELWERTATGEWQRALTIADQSVVAGLPPWNSAHPLTLPAVLAKAPLRADSLSGPIERRGPQLFVPSESRRLLAVSDRNEGLLLYQLRSETMSYVGTLPVENRGAGSTWQAFSNDGSYLAEVWTTGELCLWDLQRAAEILDGCQVGFGEFLVAYSRRNKEPIIRVSIIPP